MTDIAPSADGRVPAWVLAWNALQSAADIRAQIAKKDSAGALLPDIYWATVAEAAVFADLARADMPTGLTACMVVNQVEAAKQATLATLMHVFGDRTAPAPTAILHDFQPVDGHPDDDECTHRSDGTDTTYCGEPRDRHTS